ncbi:related to kinetoplast-associated protein KAP [Serendipita indica DSM 11827]|uniref:Related to kinetoplast-associated protein KAP n=1 Tax=Serendipita indica (strain DSM 11827) TaxID=1109443 RepID=G4TFS2_SERID|nr:related to kinetoplast-associated protein KAP [Serendipita indica DSM 11827]
MRQPNPPVQGESSNYYHRLPPIPSNAPPVFHPPPPLLNHHSDGSPKPPVPARPPHPDAFQRPLSAQGLVTGESSPFPVPPPPPPLPPRVGQAVTPPATLGQNPNQGLYVEHALQRPLSQMNLNGTMYPHPTTAFDLQRQGYMRQEEERKLFEEIRLEKERLRMQREELERQQVEIERQKREEENRRLEAERIERERIEAQAREEAERRERELRERWAEEERARRAKWEEEERKRIEEERARWLAEEIEQNKRLQRELEDARLAAEMSLQAERERIAAEEREKRLEEETKAAIAAMEAKEKAEREEARRIREEKDAAMARQMQEESANTTGNANPPTSAHQTPQRVNGDLPLYDDPQAVAVNPISSQTPPPHHLNPPIHAQQSVHAPVHAAHPPPMRPHANTVHAISPPLVHPPPPEHVQRPPMHVNVPGQMNQPMSHLMNQSPIHHPMMGQPEHPPFHAMMPPQLSNQNAGPSQPYRNHFFPSQNEEPPIAHPPVHPNPAQSRPQRTPNKLVRQSNSVGGGNPNRTSYAPNKHHVVAPPGPSHSPSGSGHFTSSPSGSRPSTSTAMERPIGEHDSSPGAGPSTSAVPLSAPMHIPPVVHPPGIQIPSDPLAGILHGFGRPVIRQQPLPAPTPIEDVITLNPEPAPPFYIVAHTWKNLVKFIAGQSATRIEPSPAALAREKRGPPNLRLVLHFVKMPTGDWRIILYMAVQSISPPPEDYPITDTSVVPWLFPAPEPGRPLENLPETQIYSIPTKPLPVLPLSLPHLAPYLNAALAESARSNDSRARLQKLVQASVVATPTSLIRNPFGSAMGSSSSSHGSVHQDHELPGGPIRMVDSSSGGHRKGFITRIFRPKSSSNAGKSVNNDTYDLVTPFSLGDYA